MKTLNDFINEQLSSFELIESNENDTLEIVNEGLFRDIFRIGKKGYDIVTILQGITKEYFTEIEKNTGHSVYWSCDKKGIYRVVLDSSEGTWRKKDKLGENTKIFSNIRPVAKEKHKDNMALYYILGNFETRNSEKGYNELVQTVRSSRIYKYMANELKDSRWAKKMEQENEKYQAEQIKKRAKEAEERGKKYEQERRLAKAEYDREKKEYDDSSRSRQDNTYHS